MSLEQLLTVDEVAERLQIHPETIRRWLREGRLEGYRISRKGGWRIRPQAVTDMLESEQFEGKLVA
jgi:excisionase family DNA binding protein